MPSTDARSSGHGPHEVKTQQQDLEAVRKQRDTVVAKHGGMEEASPAGSVRPCLGTGAARSGGRARKPPKAEDRTVGQRCTTEPIMSLT